MAELLSALSVALETCLPERVACGETSVDEFFDAEGFSLNELSMEIEQVSSCHTELQTLLGQRASDPRVVFSDQQSLNSLIAIVSRETEDEAVVMSSGGLGRTIQAGNLAAIRTSLSKTNRSLDGSRFERADSLTEIDPQGGHKDRIGAPRVESNHSGIKQDYSKHEQEVKDYSRLYAAGRRELGKASLKTIEVDLAKKIVRYQIQNLTSGYRSHKEDERHGDWANNWAVKGVGYAQLGISYGHKKQWVQADVQKADYNGITSYQVGAAWGYNKHNHDVDIYDVDPDNKTGGETIYLPSGGGDNPMIMSNRADGYAISFGTNAKKWSYQTTIYTTGSSVDINYREMKKGKVKYNATKTISFKQILEHTKAYKRDKELVQAHQQGDLIPKPVKEKFGRILAFSAIAYNIKRRTSIENRYWPNTYSKIIGVSKKSEWGGLYQYNRTMTNIPVRHLFTKDQKHDAKLLRMLYGAQLAVNASVKHAAVNAQRVYNRSIGDGLSGKQAKLFANLTYFSDIVLFDSFIASSEFSSIASSKLSQLTGAKNDLSLMTYALMPFVIRRQMHDSEHILNLEKIEPRTPKLASALLTYDLFKNKCLTQVLHYGYSEYEQYLSPDPVHRILRLSKNTIKRDTQFLDKWVFDPLIGVAVRLVTFNQFHGTFLKKMFNGSLGFAESIGFAMVHAAKTLPKHLFKDTRTLSYQLGRVFTGRATWQGSWDALGRDTKGIRHTTKFLAKTAFDASPLGLMWYTSHGEIDPLAKNIDDLFHGISVGISAARHKAEIKKDMAIFHAETRLHHRLHEWAPDVIRSPYQLLSKHNKCAQKLNSYLKSVAKKDKAFLEANKFHPKKLHEGIVTQKQSISSHLKAVKAQDPQKILSLYIWRNLDTLKAEFKTISERQASRLHRQIILLTYINKNSKTLERDFTATVVTQREFKRLSNYLRSSISSQINYYWNNDGAKSYFKNLFIQPIVWTLPMTSKQSKSAREEIWHIQHIYRHNKIGKRIFTDILLGDLAARVIHNPSFGYVGKTLSSKLKASLFGESLLHLLKWDSRNAVSRINFILSVGSRSVSAKGVKRDELFLEHKAKVEILNALLKGTKLQKEFAIDDCRWIHHSIKHHYLKNRRSRITKKANNDSNSVDAAWRKDTSIINKGGTMNVGSIVNSLSPSDKDWQLTIKKPEDPATVKPGPSAISLSGYGDGHSGEEKPTSNQNEPLKVNLMGFYGRIKIAKKKYDWLTGKKKVEDPAKRDAEAAESEAKADVETMIEEVETEAVDDIKSNVEETVDTEVTDAEAIASDAEIDILA